MTSDQIVYQQRVRALDHARKTGNVAETCRTFGISRKTFYKWRNAAAKYGLAALRPKTKRPPAMPNATPTHVLEVLLTLAITTPTLGAASTRTGSPIKVSRSASRRCRTSWSRTVSAAAINASLVLLRSQRSRPAW